MAALSKMIKYDVIVMNSGKDRNGWFGVYNMTYGDQILMFCGF